MSIISWKKEFYKGRLREAARDPLCATEHSLRKWTGLRAEHLKAHGLVVSDGSILNPSTKIEFGIDSSTCALCVMCMGDNDYVSCRHCPILQVTGKRCDGDSQSPYLVWYREGDPEPMIATLTVVRDKLLADK